MNAWTPFLHPMYIGLLLLANSAYFLEVEQCILFDLHKWPNQTLSAKLVEIFWWALFHTTCYLCSFSFWNKHHKELAFLKSYSTSTDTKTLWIRLKKKGLISDSQACVVCVCFMTCMEFIGGGTLCDAMKHSVNKMIFNFTFSKSYLVTGALQWSNMVGMIYYISKESW